LEGIGAGNCVSITNDLNISGVILHKIFHEAEKDDVSRILLISFEKRVSLHPNHVANFPYFKQTPSVAL
jgi:hypothetical protein